MTSSILSKKSIPDSLGRIQNITPENAGWKYIGFDVYLLKSGQTISFDTKDREYCLVLIAGLASIKTKKENFLDIGKRMSPFERIPPFSVYVPHHDEVLVTAKTDLELAVCSAPGFGSLPARLIKPEDVDTEHRGKGKNQRYVQNILPDYKQADSLLVVEVYTDEGNTSSYPSHKHDRNAFPDETLLEETYYHRFDPQQGFCLQRVYTDDRSLDECAAAYDKDVVKVPKGYHPVATIAGYNSYYLNVMAGPIRQWRFTWEKDHAWINSESYPIIKK